MSDEPCAVTAVAVSYAIVRRASTTGDVRRAATAVVRKSRGEHNYVDQPAVPDRADPGDQHGTGEVRYSTDAERRDLRRGIPARRTGRLRSTGVSPGEVGAPMCLLW